jgi:hypothetical protein
MVVDINDDVLDYNGIAWKEYKNSGHSGVVNYMIADNLIILEFKDHTIYVYSRHKAGASVISEMKRRANEGEKLSSYINQTPAAKNGYEVRYELRRGKYVRF